jgi:hypothetical protein
MSNGSSGARMLPKPSTMKWVAANTTTVGWSPSKRNFIEIVV